MNLRSYYRCPLCKREFALDGDEDWPACPTCKAASWMIRTVSVDGDNKEHRLYRCYECDKLTDDPHTSSAGEDVCEECCDICSKKRQTND